MIVTPATLRSFPEDGSPVFSPYATETPSLDDYDYVQEEWIAIGDEDGRPYATTILVRRPRDVAHFSGMVIAEPLHVHGIAPIWIYTAPYMLRSGHAWVEITAQKTTLDMHVKPSNPDRYGALHIEGPATADFDPNPRLGNPDTAELFWSELERRNRATNSILAQVGAALRASPGPFEGWDVADIILAGHSQTGSVTTYFIRDAHRRAAASGRRACLRRVFPVRLSFRCVPRHRRPDRPGHERRRRRPARLLVPARLRRPQVPPRRQRRARRPLSVVRAGRRPAHGHPAVAVQRGVALEGDVRRTNPMCGSEPG